MTKKIFINVILFSALAVTLSIIQIFVFWFMFGEGAESERIADLWQVNLILEYLPFLTVLFILSLRTFQRYNKNEFDKLKINLITILIFVVLYLSRYQIINLIEK